MASVIDDGVRRWIGSTYVSGHTRVFRTSVTDVRYNTDDARVSWDLVAGTEDAAERIAAEMFLRRADVHDDGVAAARSASSRRRPAMGRTPIASK